VRGAQRTRHLNATKKKKNKKKKGCHSLLGPSSKLKGRQHAEKQARNSPSNAGVNCPRQVGGRGRRKKTRRGTPGNVPRTPRRRKQRFLRIKSASMKREREEEMRGARGGGRSSSLVFVKMERRRRTSEAGSGNQAQQKRDRWCGDRRLDQRGC